MKAQIVFDHNFVLSSRKVYAVMYNNDAKEVKHGSVKGNKSKNL